MNDDTEPGLAKAEITLPDGRYLIYYTFPAAEPAAPGPDIAANGDGPSPA